MAFKMKGMDFGNSPIRQEAGDTGFPWENDANNGNEQ